MIPKVLIVDKMHESILEMLISCGFEPDYRPNIDKKTILDQISPYTGIIVRSKIQVDEKLLVKAHNLKFVARAGAGIDNVDYPLLVSRGIKLINAPEGNRDALGEHTVGMLLALFRKINQADLQVRRSVWDREGNRGWEIKGKTVGIYGFGFMGSAFAEKLKGFGARIITYDKYKHSISDEGVQQVSLEQFYHETEILSIHVPLTSETRRLFSKKIFERFSQLKVIINTARGEVLNLQDLITLLDQEQLVGVCLDVLENEKLDKLSASQQELFTKLVNLEKVILTPHIAGWTYESYYRINEIIVSKLKEEGLTQVR